MSSWVFPALCAFLLALATSAEARAASWNIEVTPPPGADAKTIEKLRQRFGWNTRAAQFEIGDKFTLVGTYSRKNWSLLSTKGAVLKSAGREGNDFTVELVADASPIEVRLLEIGPAGEPDPVNFRVQLTLAAEEHLYLVRSEDAAKRIPQLQFALEEDGIPVAPASAPRVTIDGNHLDPGWKVALDEKPLEPPAGEKKPSEGDFRLDLPLPRKELRFKATGPDGKTREEVVLLSFTRPASAARRERDIRLSPSVGFALNSYTETGRPDYSAFAFFAKISANRVLVPQKWDVDANAFLTLLPLSTSVPDVSARFLGMNVRVGYTLPKVEKPWTARFAIGAYYTTMFVTQDRFGYSSLIYPQLYPVVSYQLPDGSALTSYIKIVPTQKELGLSLDERELATGVSWRRLWRNRTVIFSLDFSDLTFKPTNRVTIHTNSLSLSGGLAF